MNVSVGVRVVVGVIVDDGRGVKVLNGWDVGVLVRVGVGVFVRVGLGLVDEAVGVSVGFIPN